MLTQNQSNPAMHLVDLLKNGSPPLVRLFPRLSEQHWVFLRAEEFPLSGPVPVIPQTDLYFLKKAKFDM